MKKLILLSIILSINIAHAERRPTIAEKVADQVAEQSNREASEAEIAKIKQQLNIQPIENRNFTAYVAKDNGARGLLPIKLAIVGSDTLSIQFLKQHRDEITQQKYRVLLIGNEQILTQFKEAYPEINVSLYELNDEFNIMANHLGIKYYPCLYDEGMVKP